MNFSRRKNFLHASNSPNLAATSLTERQEMRALPRALQVCFYGWIDAKVDVRAAAVPTVQTLVSDPNSSDLSGQIASGQSTRCSSREFSNIKIRPVPTTGKPSMETWQVTSAHLVYNGE